MSDAPGRGRADEATPGRVLVTGASGLIGAALCARLAANGYTVVRLVRRAARAADEVAWDPVARTIDRDALEEADAVVHLAGAGIGEARWTASRRALLRESRVGPTRFLAESLAALRMPPHVLVSASAVGWYGDRGDAWLDESSAPGEGFLAEVAREWEDAAKPAALAGVRLVHPRTGLVLAPRGGALAKLLPLFRTGLGGSLGSGRQWWSWITLDDLVGAMVHAITNPHVLGPLNAVAPAPVTNAEFTRALGRALGRPALLPAPALALRLALGRGMADELLLASQRVRPAALTASGFAFRDAELEPALRRLVGRA